MSEWQAVLEYWLEQVGPKGWYVADDAVDAEIRQRFAPLVDRALAGELPSWTETPEGTLALIILLDQFTRNLHRGSPEAFAGDARARDIARVAIANNHDMKIPEPARQFFYVPFEHSENLADQDWSVSLFRARMTTLTEQVLWHVDQHREVIQRFGRFPYRNAALGRQTTADEQAFLDEGGYTPGLK